MIFLVGGLVGSKTIKLMKYSTKLKLKLKFELSLTKIYYHCDSMKKYLLSLI